MLNCRWKNKIEDLTNHSANSEYNPIERTKHLKNKCAKCFPFAGHDCAASPDVWWFALFRRLFEIWGIKATGIKQTPFVATPSCGSPKAATMTQDFREWWCVHSFLLYSYFVDTCLFYIIFPGVMLSVLMVQFSIYCNDLVVYKNYKQYIHEDK